MVWHRIYSYNRIMGSTSSSGKQCYTETKKRVIIGFRGSGEGDSFELTDSFCSSFLPSISRVITRNDEIDLSPLSSVCDAVDHFIHIQNHLARVFLMLLIHRVLTSSTSYSWYVAMQGSYWWSAVCCLSLFIRV